MDTPLLTTIADRNKDEWQRKSNMQNVIDVSNHILKYSQVYTFEAPVTDLVKEEALQLCLKHGEEFVIVFIENYLQLMMEELYERN